jgi:hypothetical protein
MSDGSMFSRHTVDCEIILHIEHTLFDGFIFSKQY